jgi:hypothetical protein
VLIWNIILNRVKIMEILWKPVDFLARGRIIQNSVSVQSLQPLL